MPSRPIDPPLHGVLDYTTGALLQALPKALDLDGTPAGRVLHAAGAVHGGYSLFTDYELGLVKVIPFPVHLKLDALWSVALGAAPLVTGDWRRGRRRWLPHVLLALYELGALAMTEPGDQQHPERPAAGVKRPVDEAPPAFPNGLPPRDGAPRPAGSLEG
jgi:hypothetical protein